MQAILRFFSFVFQYKLNFFSGFSCLVASIALANMQPLFVKWLTSSVQAGDLGTAYQYGFWLAGVLLASNLLLVTCYQITDKGLIRISTDIMEKTLTHIHLLDFSYHANKSSGKLIGILKRGDEAFFTFYENMRQLFDVVVSTLVMFIIFSTLRPSYFFLVVIMFIAVTISSVILIRFNMRRRKKV